MIFQLGKKMLLYWKNTVQEYSNWKAFYLRYTKDPTLDKRDTITDYRQSYQRDSIAGRVRQLLSFYLLNKRILSGESNV